MEAEFCTLGETVNWMADQKVSLQALVDEIDDNLTEEEKPKYQSMVDEISRDFHIILRKIDLFAEKATMFDENVTQLVLVEELSDYCESTSDFLDKLTATGLVENTE